MKQRINAVNSILTDCTDLRTELHSRIYINPDKIDELKDRIKELPFVESITTTGKNQLQFEFDKEQIHDENNNIVFYMINAIIPAFKNFLMYNTGTLSDKNKDVANRIIYGDLHPSFLYEVVVIGETVYITL